MPHGKRRHKIVSPRRERSRSQDEVGRIIVEVNPGLHFYLQGESEFHHGHFGAAIQCFSIALTILENFPTAPPQLTAKALLSRAQCFFFLGALDQSVRDCTKALNISKMMGFQEGIFEAIVLKMFTGEVTGDVRGAFQLAVFLKTLDLKRAISHVRRLRENLEGIFQEDPTLANELGENLMRTGIEFFTNNCFKEAAEYFSEVIRLVSEFNFVREAYIYQAKCQVKLGEYDNARDLCSKVLQRFPGDEDGKTLLESINTKILERKRVGAKKKNSKMPSNSQVLEKQVVPEKKRVLNKKQRQYEEYRRKKETEEIGKEIRDQIDKDREKQEQKQEKEKTVDGAKSRPMPSFDVKAAFYASNSRRETTDKQIKVQAVVGPGARPKQRKPIEISRKSQDKDREKKKHKDVACKKNGKTASEKSGPIELQPQRQGPGRLNVSNAVEGRRPLPGESFDSKWDVRNINQTVHTSTKEEHGWIPVTSKKQRLKSVVKSSSSPDWPSLPVPSFLEDNGSLQGSNSTATKRFPANRVGLQEPKSEQKARPQLRRGFVEDTEYVPRQSNNSSRHLESPGLDSILQEPKSKQKSREHFRRGFAINTEYVPQQSHSSSRHLESAGLDSSRSHADSTDSTDQESSPDVAFNGLSERRIPVRFSDPSLKAFPEARTLDFERTPVSQWECLEQISPLQIHHNLDLGNKTKTGVLNTNAESEPSLDTDVSPQAGLNFSWAPPRGVSTLCEHFLQDNRKGQPFRHPKPCSNCTKRSKIAYGIWKSDTKEWQVMRPYPRDVSPNVPFQLCWHFSSGVKCQKRPCTFAHGIEELTFWTSERQSGRAPFGQIASPEGSTQENDFQDVPKPQERIRGSLIIRDIRSSKPRPPPTGVYNGQFQLCKWWKSGRVCRYGTYCTFAHGENELKSWMGYQSEIQEAKCKELPCQKSETSADISRSEMVYSLPGVEVTCNKPATVKIILGGDEKRHILHWEFTVKFKISEVGKLCEIDLLHRYHDCYRLTKITGFINNVEIFSEVPRARWSYNLPNGTWNDTKEGQMKVVVSVSFETTPNNQTFTQCLRFDFGKKPFLLQGLNVDIARKEALDTLCATREELKLHSSVWREGSVDIVRWSETTNMGSQDLLLLKKYKLPERIENIIPAQIIDGELSVQNYKRVMHQLLFTEELFRKKAISSFVFQNVQLDCQQSISNDWSGVVYAGSGELFGIVRFQDNESLQPDDAASRLLIRSVNSAWIKIVGSSSQNVYETLVQVESECVAFKLSSQMCSELNVSDGGQISVDVQFQLNRKPLCDWHAAIDRLGPIQLRLLFPIPDAPHMEQEDRRPWNWMPLDPKLNTNQKEVLKRILAPGDTSSPVVVFGPFGTGKTFTLNQAIRHLVTKKHNRILLCTHTNSAADIHVSLLHDYLTKQNGLKATKPLRIYHTNRSLITDSEEARMYGLIENNTYVLPKRNDVIRHRVVITTLAMSQHLLELQLNHGFFTHILVDEAAQALELEALIPLALAGPNTKVVVTGDHMQMGPEVYSHYARAWGLQRSLPERLFDHYCEKGPSDDSVMFLTENYRSHPDILQFPSDNFYGNELIARSEQASHPRFGPLLFFAVHGVEEARENSYINTTEVDEIVKRVKLLADDWPAEWKKKDLSQIGVISAYGSQVRAIRRQLRTKGLGNVTVESIHNVQGKEFRALFISTVRTSLTCHSFDRCESQSLYWEFLSDPKLLNTAITRAMSLVAVVGDPDSLSTAGDCRGNWRDYIRRCHVRGTLHGASYEEIIKKIDAPLAKISLNPEANEFVPQSMEVSSKELKSLELVSQPQISNSQVSRSVEESDLEVDKNEKGSALGVEDRCTIPAETYRSGIETIDTKEELAHRESTSKEEEEEKKANQFSPDSTKDSFNSVKQPEDFLYQQQGDFASQDELQSGIQSQEEEDDVEQSASDNFEELPRESFEDETVFPRYLDKIIKALVEQCRATKEKEAHPCGSSENETFPSLQTATKSTNMNSKSKPGKRSGNRDGQEKSCSFDHSEDYEMRVVNGRQEVRIVNLGFHQRPTARHQRLTAVSRQEDFPDPQILQQWLVKEPGKYLPCTLRLNSETSRAAYAEISDTETPDIKIRGRVRGAFDMDQVVVQKMESQPSPSDGVSRCHGKVAGVLNHIISPHERQYVCKADYESPGVMIPINKSMSKIVNLSDKNLNGLPLYKEIHDGSERPFRVELLDFTEALSGKFLFLVQYLQWRSDCHSPLGIVIRKLSQGNTLSDSMKILLAEHGVRDCFSKESEAEVQAKFPPGWSIPVEEDRIREKIEGAFTIDPDNSKDLDDALTLEQLSDSVNRVGVHIADVSYFVEPDTKLDKEAMFRCTSYYPGHDSNSVPMLPRELSENHCSLLPGKDRLCVSVFLDVSEEGRLVGQPKIRRTVLSSSCQLTYPEAQKIIDGQDSSLHHIPQDVKEKVEALSCLSQKRRKLRLSDASFDHWSNSDDYGEDFEAHELVEEMMLLANEEVAKFLSRSQHISERAPLRTQLPPKEHKLNDWVRQYGQFIKYSLFLRGVYSEETLSKMANKAIISEASEFKVQESVWSELCNAAETGDQAKLHKLICNESNHPQLAVANSQFRRIQPKSQYVCRSDQPEANVRHFSLGMDCYTHFTSPIRRYIDIQVHRLVLNLISKSPNGKISSKDQVAKVCRRSTFAQDNSRKFGKASNKVHLAAKLKEKSHETTAVIASIDTDKEITLEILNREYNHLPTRQRKVKLSSLNPFAVDIVPNSLEIVLTWKLRLYIAPEENVIEEPETEREKIASLLSKGMVRNREVLNLPAKNWLEILEAFQEGDYRNLKKMITQTERVRQLASRVPESNRPGKPPKSSKDEKADKNMEHFYEKKISLRKFDIVHLQLTAHRTQGVFHPEIQLFKINPSINICIEHRKYPRECFATTAMYQASRKTYASVNKYVDAWEPVLAMEAATSAVEESDEFTIHRLKIEWKKDISGSLEGSFSLQNEYCLSRQIEFHAGDFVCVRVREDSYMKITGSEHRLGYPEETETEGETNLSNEDQFSVTKSAAFPSVRGKPCHGTSCASESFWVGHCIISPASELSNTDTLKVKMDLHQSASDFPEELLSVGDHLSTVTFIHRSLPHRRMFAALRSLPSASRLAHSICMGRDPNQEHFEAPLSFNLSIVRDHPKCGFKPLNSYQEEAVKEALVKPFTLVQGPPGTGKTVTGVHIAYWFAKRNMQQRQDDLHVVLPDSGDQPKAPPQVIYCGPSNKSVDVVAKYMLQIPELKIIRVYGDRREQAEFPIPNKRQPLKNSTDDDGQISNENIGLKAISLHHVIRRSPCPFASELREYERKFDDDRKNNRRTSDKEVKGYVLLIGLAENWALQSSGVQIILCTCAVAGMRRIATSCDNIQQCIVDECGMCMELESLVPITCSKARQVVLIGDHKQLQPIIQDNLAMTLGLSVSMFERLSERAKMLELQYRMDPTLADELGDNLIRNGTDHFRNNRFKEAAEYFTEVIRLVCKFSFVRDAYVYQAKCHVNLGEYEEARDLCTTVLKRFPDDDEGKLLLERIDTIILERKKGTEEVKKKTSKKPSSSRVPEKLVVPEKKPVPNKKQRKKEEYRRMKEAEEMLKDFQSKIKEDQKKQEQKNAEENRELDGAKSLATPSYDVKAALDASNSTRVTTDKQIKVQVGTGARPTQIKPIEVSGKTQDRNRGNKKQKDVGCKRNGKAISEKSYPTLKLKSQCRGFASLDVSIEGRMPLPANSTNSERGVSNTNQTAPTSTDQGDGWTLVMSKRQILKSVAERTSIPDWPSLPGPSFVQDESTLQGSNSTATKVFSANRVELQELKYEQKPSRHFRRGPAFASSGFAESRAVDSQNSPKSQWESLQQISHLQIHGVLANQVKSDPPLHRFISPQVGSNVQGWAPPQGVSTLCAHFLEDNRKGQPYRYPSPCSKCTKQSKLLYGIWRSDTKEWQVMRSYPKDVNPNVPFQLCRHFNNHVKCQKNPCTFAHGKKELMFWTLERQAGRSLFGRITDPKDSHHENDFQSIPKAQERVRGSLTIRDIRSTKPRPPPTGVSNGKFQLCKWWNSGRVCRYGAHCSFAHGRNELESWMGHNWEIQEPKNEEELSCQTPQTSADISRSEIQMIYSLPGVEVLSNKPATVKISHRGEERHNFHWEFTVKFEISEVGKLCQIDLLHRYHDCYRLTKITGFLNNVQQFSGVPEERWSYNIPNGSWIDIKEGQMKVVVSVSFEAIASNRTFTQCLRLDFGQELFLLQGLNVDIASEEALDKLSATREELKLHSSVWKEGLVDIILAPETSDMSSQNLLLLRKYKLPERIENVISAQVIDGNMTVHNYKRVMHQLLFTEELFMKKAISSFVLQNVQLECQQSIGNDWTGVFYAGSGELFGILKFQENESLRPDDAASRLLIRNVTTAWIKMADSSSQKVYEALVQKVENDYVALKLSPKMCLDLNISEGVQILVDVQFQLNRKPLCDWHSAIDRLGPLQLRLLFATPSAPQIEMEERRPWNWLALDTKLNTNQREVIERILAPGNTSSPLVVFGPFGTGKTFTLNQAIRQLVTRKHNRILLCTHTNSAADLHVTLLHDYLTDENGLEATKPLRIYQTDRRLNADSEVARKYGLISNDAYVLPTRDDVIRHRVVITTLAMSQHLLELQLNHGFFTHILVDEAAQALEPEALIPLALAGPNTKVVFTGDHMQMSPEVYSHYARDWGLQRSLPERLFDHYCEKMPSDDSVMFLTENYRCHPDILQFPSDNFYGKELIARGKQALHPRFGPLLFFSVHGFEEARENSYINTAEVDEIVKRVELLADDWPVEWKKKDLSKIGVISAYMTQVRAIRTQLRSKGLGSVTVESIHNVQGKEFRALFISTVRTSLTCHSFDRVQSESQSPYWEFLSDPKLLNTAITRAMSLVAVVGDPVSLCTAGDCRGNWRDYIRRCHERRTLHGESYQDIKNKIDAPLANISLNPHAIEFVPHLMEVSSKELKSLQFASQLEISDSQTSRSVEKSDLEVDRNEKISASSMEEGRTIAKEKNGSGNKTDDGKVDLTQEESTAEEKEQQEEQEQEEQQHEEQRAGQFSADLQNELNSVRRSEYQQGVEFTFREEPESEIQSQKENEEDDDVEQSADGFEEFLRESFEDETVFPRYLDKIIKALVEKCKATKEKEARLHGSSENAAFPSLLAATSGSYKQKSKTSKRLAKRTCQAKSSSFDYSSEDYEICVVNGRQEVRIVNLGFQQTPTVRHQRPTTVSSQDDFLDSQLLQKLLLEQPDKYQRCTLRLNSEIIRTAYAEISDTTTPAIKIRGRVRGAFDMDHVVVEKIDTYAGIPPCQGKVAGVLSHIISPHERQYVCKADYESPGVMIPINKSMSKIVILSDKNLNGLPLYKEIHDGSERPFKVDVMDFTEAMSGKFLFLVQYLQWRSDCYSPLGIVIRKLPQGNTLSDSMKILFAEHGVRDWFSKESKAEVRAKFPPGWSIPVEEYESRQKIEGAFTIDPDKSKDLDDALTLEQLSGSVNQVGVHIADVSYFVEPGTELDKEAMFRSTSHYPGHDYQSVPMLPRELSENHCSLLPGKDRLCISVFLDVTDKGQLVGQPEIRRTIVKSSCRLTYPEAQNIIDSHDTSLLQIPKDVKEKIGALSALAQRRRILRLRDASFDHWSNSDDDGQDFEAHELIEEMMLLANEEIAKFLSQQNPERTPLRTQLPPKDHKLNDWVKQYGQFIKYSLFLHGFYSEETLSKMANEGIMSEASEFKVQESVWSELCNAAETGHQSKLRKLICNESNHPQLAVANSQFQRIQPKSQYVCESDQPKENVVHFSLRMRCYTHFTSPIRRYIDIQVHRLVLNLISQRVNAKFSSKEQVAKVCRRSTFAQDNSRKFEKACNKVNLAAKLKEKSHETTAVIALIDTDKEITLEILNREYNHLSTRQRKVKLSSLNPFDVEPVTNGSEIVLTWKLRLYIAPEENIIEDAQKEREKIAMILSEEMARSRKVLNLPAENWLEIMKTFQMGNYGKLKSVVSDTDRVRQSATQLHGSTRPGKPHRSSNDGKIDQNLEHFYEKKLFLRKFDMVNVQLTTHMTHGVFHPEIQLFKINPSVHVCVEHRKYPKVCFASTARYQVSQKTYASVNKYIDVWKPVLAMEAATRTVDESDEFTIYHLKIEWKHDIDGNREGSFSLRNEYCSSRQIEFYPGDFVCVRVREDSNKTKTGSESNCASPERTETEGDTNLLNEDKFSATKPAVPTSVRSKRRHEFSCAESFWVGHCIIKYTKEVPDKDALKVTVDLHQSASNFPDELLSGGGHLSTLTVIHRLIPHRRMFAALCSLPSASQLAHSICLGHEPSQDDFGAPPSLDLSVVKHHPNCGFKPLNQYQEEAVKEALGKPFTLVQGPPGTGKTVTGVHIAYWFVKRNMQQRQDDLDIVLPNSDDDDDDQSKGQVIYCGPSNKSVDVVAKYMLKIPDLKIIRVYGDRREQAEFPIPNKRQPLKNSTDDNNQISNEDDELKAVSLHHVIRRSPCPFAAELGEYERKFDDDRKKDRRTSDKEVEDYRELIGQAESWALQESGVQIILCTCAVSGKPRLTRSCGNIQQCVVDECGMCMELESLVPITSSKARQVVLIGDHKQLQPVIQDNLAMTLGLSVSMFERLSKRAKMLELQYRMQEEICRFPSEYFYEEKLKTDRSVSIATLDPRLQSFWPAPAKLGQNFPMAFCHVEGEEESSSIKTEHSNEQSKANEKEVRKVLQVVTSLVYEYDVDASKVVILSPYREQRRKISESLKKDRCKDIPVTTIVKSQGSEWDYVILSLVRSLSKGDIDPEPSPQWQREHLGFLTDEHQMNVGLTRARKGLCIIGNKNLLKIHPMWQELIQFYEKKHCLVDESEWPRN